MLISECVSDLLLIEVIFLVVEVGFHLSWNSLRGRLWTILSPKGGQTHKQRVFLLNALLCQIEGQRTAKPHAPRVNQSTCNYTSTEQSHTPHIITAVYCGVTIAHASTDLREWIKNRVPNE